MPYLRSQCIALGVLFLLAACSGAVDIVLNLTDPSGLEAGKDVRLHDQRIGKVKSVSPAPTTPGYVVTLALESDQAGAVQRNAAAYVADYGGGRSVVILNPPAAADPVAAGATIEGLNSPLEVALWQATESLGAASGFASEMIRAFSSYLESDEWQAAKNRIAAEIESLPEQTQQATDEIVTGLEEMLNRLEAESAQGIRELTVIARELGQRIDELKAQGEADLAESLQNLLRQLESIFAKSPAEPDSV